MVSYTTFSPLPKLLHEKFGRLFSSTFAQPYGHLVVSQVRYSLLLGLSSDNDASDKPSTLNSFLSYTRPEKPINAIAKIPAVIKAIGIPLNVFGRSVSSSFSLNPANNTNAKVNPIAVATAKTMLSAKL